MRTTTTRAPAFARLKTRHPDMLLAPHAEVFDMAGKRTHIHDQTNPFIGPGELDRLTAAMAADFDKQLARQSAPQGRQT